MTKNTPNIVINLIRNNLNSGNYRGLPISPETQALASIRYLSKAAYGDDTATIVHFEKRSFK